MQFEITDLGFANNIDVIQSFLSLGGLRVLDVGCGNLGFTEQLAAHATSVLAIDPDPIQAQANRSSSHSKNITFIEAAAESIPEADDSIDGAFFAYSLHHIEAVTYPEVFDEVFRVLKPSGFIYVIEPVDCPFNQVMRLFHDEEVERAAAQAWLQSIASRFEACHAVEYHGNTQYQSFDDFATQMTGKSFNSLYTEADVRNQEVESAFNEQGGPEHKFQSPKRVVFLQHFRK